MGGEREREIYMGIQRGGEGDRENSGGSNNVEGDVASGQ